MDTGLQNLLSKTQLTQSQQSEEYITRSATNRRAQPYTTNLRKWSKCKTTEPSQKNRHLTLSHVSLARVYQSKFYYYHYLTADAQQLSKVHKVLLLGSAKGGIKTLTAQLRAHAFKDHII